MALDFNGSTSYLSMGDVLDGTANQTISAWIVRGSSGTRHEIISKEGSSPTGYEMTVLASNIVEVGFFNGSYPVATSTTTITPGTLYHIVGVRDNSANLVRCYVNGVQEGTTSPGAVTSSNAESLNIGRRPNSTWYFDGLIEDVRIYNRVLTPAEIETLYAARGRDFIVNGLVGHWLMTEHPPGTATGAGPGSPQNIQTNSETTTSSTISLSYTVPASLTNPVLIVCAGGDDLTFADSQASSATFISSMTKHVGVNTTAVAAAGSAIFSRAVTSGDSNTITVTYPGSIVGRTIHAFTVPNALSSVNVTATNFNNGGNATASFTTTAADKLGITHQQTGENVASISASGTGHSQISELLVGGTTFSSRVGTFTAAAAQLYSGYGFNFFSGPNRSSISMIALDAASAGVTVVPDRTLSGFNAVPTAVAYTENIAVRNH